MTEKIFFRDAEREGLLTRNPLFTSGVIIAPAVAACTDFYSASVLAMVFTAVTFPTILICRAVPRKIVYAIRIILYTLIASIVYVPIHLFFTGGDLAELYAGIGIYAPLLITNSLITLRTETKFYRLSTSYMLRLVAFYVIGYDLSLLLFGGLRGILTTGTALGIRILPFSIPALSNLFGGFILLGVMSAAFRWFIQIFNGNYSNK